jgi:hypothetical protein
MVLRFESATSPANGEIPLLKAAHVDHDFLDTDVSRDLGLTS